MFRIFWSKFKPENNSNKNNNNDENDESVDEEEADGKGSNRINFYDRKIKKFQVAPNRASIMGEPYVVLEIEGRSFFR